MLVAVINWTAVGIIVGAVVAFIGFFVTVAVFVIGRWLDHQTATINAMSDKLGEVHDKVDQANENIAWLYGERSTTIPQRRKDSGGGIPG